MTKHCKVKNVKGDIYNYNIPETNKLCKYYYILRKQIWTFKIMLIIFSLWHFILCQNIVLSSSVGHHSLLKSYLNSRNRHTGGNFEYRKL